MTEDLMVLTLTQLGFLKTEEKSKINSVSQIDDETFRIILYKVINKIIQIKNLEVTFPEMPSHEMNKRFAEAQKSVEIFKSLGYRGDIRMNSILHPEKRDKERLLEFTLEIISSEEVGSHEIAQGMTEKNMVKMKIEKNKIYEVDIIDNGAGGEGIPARPRGSRGRGRGRSAGTSTAPASSRAGGPASRTGRTPSAS